MIAVDKRPALVVGTFDTKTDELTYIADRLTDAGVLVRTVDLSTSDSASDSDVKPGDIAACHPDGAGAVATGDRGSAVAAMATAFEIWTKAQAASISGMIAAGGSGGTALVTPAMRALPIGVPKVMISTVASGDVGAYVGPSDMMMMYSVTDVQGLNTISRKVLGNGAAALAGMILHAPDPSDETDSKPGLGLMMFGVTTPAVQAIAAKLDSDYEPFVFHATGVGGQSMEKLVDSGFLDAVVDLTTTEVCDMMMGGVMAADDDRFGAIIRRQIPYVGSVGALDMVNFGAPATVPERYRSRQFYEHNPQVTLMRTTADENARMGTWIAQRLNLMEGPVRFLIPEGGVSALDAEGMPFWDPDADRALFDTLEAGLEQTEKRMLIRLSYHINDPAFADDAVAAFRAIA